MDCVHNGRAWQCRWNVDVSVQQSRKIPQTVGRPSSALYGSGKNNSVWGGPVQCLGWTFNWSLVSFGLVSPSSLILHWLWEAFESVRRGENWPTGPLVWFPYKGLDSCCLVGWSAHTSGEHIAPPDRPPGNRPLQGDECGWKNFQQFPKSSQKQGSRSSSISTEHPTQASAPAWNRALAVPASFHRKKGAIPAWAKGTKRMDQEWGIPMYP